MRLPRRQTLLLAAATLSAFALSVPASAQVQAATYKQELVQLHSATGRPMPTLVTFPKDGMNTNAPVIIHCHGGPGASPLDGSGPWIAAGMSARGYTVVAPMMAHGERLYDTDFSDYNKDVKAVVDYVASLGFKQIILTGSSFGSITITRYMVDTEDSRITALIHFAPTEDTGRFTLRGMGEEAFYKQNLAAADMIAKGKTDEVFGPVFSAPPPMKEGTKAAFMATPDRWQSLWGIGYAGNNLGLFPKLKLPILLLAGEKDGYSTRQRLDDLKAAATGSPRTDVLWYAGEVDHSFNSNPPVQPKVVADVAAWLQSNGFGVRPAVRTEIFTITDTEPGARAIRYIPTKPDAQKLAYLTVHDFDGSAMAGPPNFLAERAAQNGTLAVGIHVNRGTRGMTMSTYEAADKEIGRWVDYLAAHGYAKVVLVGHGFGATRISHYLMATKDKRIAGLVLAAPAPDGAAFLKAKIGEAAYQTALAKAQARPQSVDYTDFVYVKKTPAGVPNDMNGTLVMTPGGFLDTWGPSAPVTNAAIAKLGVPVLVLAGTADNRLTKADIDRLKGGSAKVSVRLYDGIDETLAGSEERAGWDMLRWAADQNLATLAEESVSAQAPALAPVSRDRLLTPHDSKLIGTAETVG